MNDNLLGRIKNTRKLYKGKRIKTEKQDLQSLHESSNNIQRKCQPFLQALKQISSKNKQKTCFLNLSIPVRSNKSSLKKLDTPEIRMSKQKDFFVTKMRRKQESRSKLLLERLETQNKSMSLLELCEKWKEAALAQNYVRDRSQAIKQMKAKIRQRSEHCVSENKGKTQFNGKNSKICFI